MENQTKAQAIENTLKLLTETFPACFSTSGEAKPLKIGIFKDLAERFADNTEVSKTQLRVALRRYTSGWRYLESVKAGSERVDLDGAPAGLVSEEHAEHAAQQVAESKQRAAERKKQRMVQKPSEKKASRPPKPKNSTPRKGTKPKNNPPKAKELDLKDATLDSLSVDQTVMMTLGTRPVKGVITDITKGEVQVRLTTGMVMKVQPEHLKVEK